MGKLPYHTGEASKNRVTLRKRPDGHIQIEWFDHDQDGTWRRHRKSLYRMAGGPVTEDQAIAFADAMAEKLVGPEGTKARFMRLMSLLK